MKDWNELVLTITEIKQNNSIKSPARLHKYETLKCMNIKR